MGLARIFRDNCIPVLLAAPFAFVLSHAPIFAQDQSSSPAQTSSTKSDGDQPQPATTERKKSKKVWTNENMTDVSASPISQVGPANASRAGAAQPASVGAKVATAQLVATYRKQLASLQAQQASVDKQIAELKDFLRGEPGHDSGLQLNKRYSSEPVGDQIRKLEAKRKQLAEQIEALNTAARQKGIPQNQLP